MNVTTGKTRTSIAAALVVAAGILLAACGSSGTDDTATSPSAVGGPGDPGKATRTVEIRAGDDLRFQPDSVAVKVGETITFRLVNVATVEHDFTLGDEAAQVAHEKEMQQMSGDAAHMHDMGDSANAIHVAPGSTKEITWSFTKAGSLLYGCHEPGHYASGMKGTITIT